MNDEEADIDVADEPDFNTVLTPEDEMPVATHKGAGKGFVVVGFALSTLLGAGLGIAGTQMLAEPDKTAALKTEIEQSLADLQKSADTQTKKLDTANSVQKKTKTRLDNLQAENEDLAAQIAALKTQITDLQTLTSNDEITDRIAVLEALSNEDGDVFTGANSITARLEALEKTIAEAPQLPTPDTKDEASESEAVADPSTEQPIPEVPLAEPVNADTQAQSALDILIDTFPREKMLAAVKAQEISSAKKPGWLKRTLSKHIRVRNDENIDPYATIDAAETALKNGDVKTALSHIAKLNPPVRSSAADWVQTAKKTQSQQ